MSNIYFYLSKFLAPFLNLTNLFFTTVLLFALIYFKSKSRIIFSLFKINIIVLISIVFFPLGKLGLKYLYNNEKYQKKESQCGVYSIHFVEQMLSGKSFHQILNHLSDQKMIKYRNKYFIQID